MKQTALILIIFNMLLATGFTQEANISEPQTYSVQQVQQDLAYMNKNLELGSYDFYAFASKDEMSLAYENIQQSIKRPMTALETFRLLQPFVASVGMSHCFLDYPREEYRDKYLKNGGTVFPLNLRFSQGKVLIEDNFSYNSSLNRFDEILAINGKPIQQFLEDFYRYISGPSTYYKSSTVERNLFPRMYWFFYDECKEFQLLIKKQDGEELDLTLQAIPGTEFEEKNKQKKLTQDKKKAREFRLLDNRTAYLRPGGFINLDSDFEMMDSKTWDNTEFCKFIDSAFADFRKNKIQSLIIDIRNNMGGDNSFSDYMIAYFAKNPFSIASKFSIKTSEMTKEFWRKLENVPEHQTVRDQILALDNGSCFEIDLPEVSPHEADKQFKGQVYLLINRYSYSNAASVAAIIQDYGFGTIIGEETAEEVSSYGSFHEFKLPNTQWSVAYPKAFFVRPSGDSSPRGVVPDYIVHDDLSTENDEVLEYVLNIINQNRNEKGRAHLGG